MIYLTKDSHETLWAYTSAGKVFKYDPIFDAFTLEIDVAELTEKGSFLTIFLSTHPTASGSD